METCRDQLVDKKSCNSCHKERMKNKGCYTRRDDKPRQLSPGLGVCAGMPLHGQLLLQKNCLIKKKAAYDAALNKILPHVKFRSLLSYKKHIDRQLLPGHLYN